MAVTWNQEYEHKHYIPSYNALITCDPTHVVLRGCVLIPARMGVGFVIRKS